MIFGERIASRYSRRAFVPGIMGVTVARAIYGMVMGRGSELQPEWTRDEAIASVKLAGKGTGGGSAL